MKWKVYCTFVLDTETDESVLACIDVDLPFVPVSNMKLSIGSVEEAVITGVESHHVINKNLEEATQILTLCGWEIVEIDVSQCDKVGKLVGQ